jgi:hypothetical protein
VTSTFYTEAGVSQDLEVPIPTADHAERDIVGCAVTSAEGAALAASRLQGDDFYLPACARALAASVSPVVALLEEMAEPGSRFDARVAVVAALAGESPEWLERCAQERPTFKDRYGSAARAVAEAGSRRRLMHWADQVFRGAAQPGPLREVSSQLAGLPFFPALLARDLAEEDLDVFV